MANKNFISAGEDKLFGWGQSFNATGKFPVIAKRVWATYKDMMDFVSDTSDVCPAGVILTVVNDTDKDNNGAYFVASCPTLSAPELPVIVEKIGSDVPSALEATNYSAALALIASEELPLGVLIKVTNEEIVGEGEGAKKYNSGFYVVNGVGENAALLYLSTSSGTDVTIDTVVTDVETLKTDVADLKSAVDALPESFVTDVKDASGNSVVVDGVVTLGDYATKTEVNDGLAEKVDSSVYNAKMTQVDASIAEKADASNVYTKDEVDSSFVKSEGYVAFSQDEKDKLAGIAEGAEVNYIKSVGDNLSVTDGKLEVSIPEVEVPEYEVVKLGTAEDGYAASYQLQKDGSAIGATINIPKDMVVSKGEVVENPEGHDAGLYIVLTLANATNDKLYIPANKLVDDYTGSTYVEVASNGEISIKYDDLKSALKADFDSVYDASGAAAAVQSDLDAYKSSNNAAVAAKVDSSDYTAKVTEIDGSISAIKASIVNVYTKAEVDASLDLKANVADVYTQTQVNDLIAPLAVASVVDSSLAGKVDKVDGKGLSTNDFTNDLLAKLNGIAEGAEVNYVKSVGDNLAVDGEGKLTVDLSTLATSQSLADGLATKLDASAKVNGVSFANGEATLDAGDIALGAKISPTVENGAQFDESKTIIEVLTSISNRIDSLDPTVDGEYGVAEVTGGNGVAVDGTKTNPQISVKISAEAGNMITADASGVYVSDMRSYWEAI